MEVCAYGDVNEAKDEAVERTKKVVAILSLEGINTKAVYQYLYKLLPTGEKAHVFQRVIIENIIILDSILGKTANPLIDITNSLSITDIKFWRQIAHYHRGNITKDPVERYREFYHVLEDDNQENMTEKALRHALSHPMLTYPATVSEVTRVLGNAYFDPMSQKHLDIVRQYADNLQEKAKAIFLGKII